MASGSYYWRYLFWLELAGIVFLVLGLISVRKQLSFKTNHLSVLGRVFVPASLAVFGAEHLAGAKFLMQLVPAWVPGRLFWAYFVGFALFAAALSIVLMKYVRWSAVLLGMMFILFVVLIHAPNVVAHPRDRFVWIVALREVLFASGAWALAANQLEDRPLANRLIGACRLVMAVVLMFYGIEHFLYPEFVPGVPLSQMTPAWIPVRPAWDYLVGAIMLLSSVLIVIDKEARAAATWLGIVIALLVPIIYLPLLFLAVQPTDLNTAMNYVADTLLFAGIILLLAEALPTSGAQPQRQ